MGEAVGLGNETPLAALAGGVDAAFDAARPLEHRAIHMARACHPPRSATLPQNAKAHIHRADSAQRDLCGNSLGSATMFKNQDIRTQARIRASILY
mgnify:CR=1 FL=1